MPTITLSSLEQLTYDRVDNNSVFYPKTEVDAAINEAIRVVNLFTGFVQGTIQVPGFSQPTRIFYDQPLGMLFPEAVFFERRRLERTSIPDMASNDMYWMRRNTLNAGPVSFWAPIGIRKFLIWPSDGIGGGDIEVAGAVEPTPLVNPNDTIQYPDEFHELLVEMSGYTLTLKEGGKIFSDASTLYQKFLRRMKSLQKFQNARHPRYWITEAKSIKDPGE